MTAVFLGLILLFTGTWFLVKSKSNPEVVKTEDIGSLKPKIAAEKTPAPAEVESAPADAPPELSMREPDLAGPSEAKPGPMISEVPEVDIPEPPVPAPAVPSPSDVAGVMPQPAPAAQMQEEEKLPSPADSEAETIAEVYGPFIVHGPLRPESQPPSAQETVAKTEDDGKTSDQKSASEKMGSEKDEKAMADKDSGKGVKDDGKTDKKEKDAKAMADGKAKPEIIDVTDSIASNHDMEGEPEDGPVTPPAGSKPEKTTDIKPTTSNAMPGWELLHYQSRDYITANSIHRFYRFNNVSVEGKSVWFRSPVLIMKASLGSQELLINNIKFVMSYPVVMLNNQPCFSRLDLCKLIDPVLRPSYIGSTKPFDTVVIDPGHGGSDSGAKGIYGYEKDFALKLGMHLKRVLEQRGLRVVMTRTNDVFLSLGSRVAVANKTPNCIYISLHFNSGGSAATGIETFALSPQGSSSIYGARSVDYLAFQGNKLDSENIALATAVHAGVVHHFKLVDRGVKRARWQVLKGLTKPGILFEGGFVTNANDGRLIAADNFRQELATTIAQSVINYRNALQPRRTAR